MAEFNPLDYAKYIADRIKASRKRHKDGKKKNDEVTVELPLTVKKKVPETSFKVRFGLASLLRSKSSSNPEDALIKKEEKD